LIRSLAEGNGSTMFISCNYSGGSFFGTEASEIIRPISEDRLSVPPWRDVLAPCGILGGHHN